MLKKWEDLPEFMQIEEVRPYYDSLKKKQFSLLLKRAFDVVVSFVILILLSPVFLILAVAIKLDSPGPVFFRQVRVTKYGKRFRIHKFRSMCSNAESMGTQVTIENDMRITRIGKIIRNSRLDEIAQLIDVFIGNMSFVGVRPEVERYVEQYEKEWYATFLMPAGVTNLTCIYFKNESTLLEKSKNVDETYINKILPQKMALNLKGIKKFSFINDIKLMIMTFFAVLKS